MVTNATVKQGTNLEFEVKISSVKTQNVIIEYETIDHTAVKSVDYTENKGSVIISAGSLNTKISVRTLNNSLLSNNKDFNLKVTATMAEIKESANAIGQIQPNQDLFFPKGIASNNMYSCIITATGTVKCWDGSFSVSTDLVGLSGVKSLSLGKSHMCAITAQDTVKCWGQNPYGELGNGTTSNSSAPVDVIGVTNVKSISSGYSHTCALTFSGAVKCWGFNGPYQLGVISTEYSKTNPLNYGGGAAFSSKAIDVPNLSDVKNISLGGFFSCALNTQDTIRCWGHNALGQLGGGVGGGGYGGSSLALVNPFNLTNIKQVSAAAYLRTCALTTLGDVKCWGQSYTTNQSIGPANIQGLSNIKFIANGEINGCAITAQDTVKCWNHTDKAITELAGINGVRQITNSCAIDSKGKVQCWNSKFVVSTIQNL
ncbi:MAG: Calx-beta domain-containing protein [Bdellovibrionota bacterium]